MEVRDSGIVAVSDRGSAISVVTEASGRSAILALAEDGEVVQAYEEAVFVSEPVECWLEH